MDFASVWRVIGVLCACSLLWACAPKAVSLPQSPAPPAVSTPRAPVPTEKAHSSRASADAPAGFTERRVTEDELTQACERDPELTPDACRLILARLNIRAHYHISDDIRAGRPLRVPNDFSAYKDWTPLPRQLSAAADMPRLILVVKAVPFLGWYENGQLVGDAPACIGNSEQPTLAGLYQVEEKDANHHSRSYANSFGRPAWMPWAMRLYEHVWIHAGDITGPHCSHGCVTLPLGTAEALFHWADSGTPVLIVESLADMDRVLSRRLAAQPF